MSTSRIFILCIFAVLFVNAYAKKVSTVKNDDSDFSIALLDDVLDNDVKNDTDSDGDGLAGAILKAVRDFRSDERSKTVDLRSVLAGFGIGDIFGLRPANRKKRLTKRSPDDDADFGDLFDDAPSEDGLKLEEDDDEKSTPRSNINKIPKKQILNRRAKSVDQLKTDTISESETKVNLDDGTWKSGFDYGNLSGIEDVLNVYSVKSLAKNWGDARMSLNGHCVKNMEEYLSALVIDKLWALKMDDASGRYTSGYFWGNSYWSGSSTLCMQTSTPSMEHLQESDADAVNDTQIDVEPPFEIAFYIIKLKLNSTITFAGPRTITLGLCLPADCISEDVHKIVEAGGSKNKIQILNIRDPKHNHYDMFSDVTFQILLGVTIIVSFFIVVGTIYELILTSRYKRYNKLKQLNRALHMNIPNVTDLPVVKMSNGKAMYSVNGISNNNNNSEERLNIEPPVIEEQPQLSVISELVLSFSVISNMKTICDQSVGSDTIPTIHGLRSISMVWVILGHSCLVAFKYSDNPELRKIVEKEFLFQTVTNATFSVDTFFCISGILVSFIYFRTNAKGKLDRLIQGTKGFTSGLLQFIGLLAYRFARLTAPYMFMLGVVEVSMKWFHYNSVYEPPTNDHENCPNYWWRNALYINTLFPVEQMCMLWSWYLADDSQFYVLGAVILILALSHFKTAAGALVVFLFSSWITTGYVAWSNNHMVSTDDPLALFDKIYDKPWTRLGPYLIGMATGWFLFKVDCRLKMSKITVILGWLISSAVLLALIFGLYNSQLGPITAAAYSSLSHTAWAIAVSWIVIACSTGYGGYVNSFLSATILYPFSRVTYCAYLVHPLVIRFLVMQTDHPIHLGKDMMAIIFLGQMVSSYLLSFVISLTFEAPVVTMLRILAPNKRKQIQ